MPETAPIPGEILAERNATALILRIHNPAAANAVDPAMLRDIARRVGNVDPAVRLVVLTGSGDRHFCSGINLGGAPGDDLEQRVRDGEDALRLAAAAIVECPVPVVAVVNGAAFGGGLELAVACDWRIASDGARAGMPAMRLGIVYSPEGLRRFMECIGPARLRQLFFTGRPVDAARALEIGLVDEVVPSQLVNARVEETITDVTAAAPGAVAATRRAVGILESALMPEAMQDVERLRRAAYASPEFREGMAAYAERRAPGWVP